jgi:hexosaminidase
MNTYLLPVPQRMEWLGGYFHFSDQGLIVLDSDTPQNLLTAGAVIEKALWAHAKLNWELNASVAVPREDIKIHMHCASTNNARSQSYTLSIKPNIIDLESQSPTGLFYAAQTLAQLITYYGRDIPCVEIEDWPDFEHRGVMLDISRDKVYKNETLYELIDRLASIKINQIQLYTEHTFAYHNHPEVWKNASPMTGEEILALDRYCRERFIELIPNQNSFGHMHRWLTHERYAPLAEILGEFEVPWGIMSGPFSLAPEEPGSFELISGLYDELLPHFSSRVVNIGCDETFDLGKGKSKTICELIGIGNVYLDYLLRLYSNLKPRGFSVQFWGDILLEHPELVQKLPKDMIALEWGYEANHPFAEHAQIFAASGLPFYVCPGTSAWNSLAGRTENAVENLRNAAESGKTNHAIGYLNTDWGDSGHWQAVPVSYLGYAMGAAYSWSGNTNKDIDITEVVSRLMFDDPSGNMGKIFYDLGNLYLKAGPKLSNSSILNTIMQTPLAALESSDILKGVSFEDVLSEINQILMGLSGERMTRPDADVIRSEVLLTAQLLRHACHRALAVTRGDASDGNYENLAVELKEIMAEYHRLWLIRNRVGGLTDSMVRFEKMLKEYQS